jgi:hypothetical protein
MKMHGFWAGTKSQQRFYNIWAGMKKRCREFDLSKEEDRLECFNFSNMRPMWEPDNFRRR